MASVSPFTKAVVASMRQLYPEALADKSFDNTGLLLEAPIQNHLPRKFNSVLLAIDLTRAVADEAIEENHSAVVAYHPIIFRGLKSITLDDSQQQSLLRLASHGISVYSPHTAVDIVPDGMADWLCDIVTGKVEPAPEPKTFTAPETDAAQQPSDATEQPSEADSETDVTTSGESEPVTPSDVHDSTDPFLEDPKTPKPEQKQKQKRPNLAQRTYSKPSYPSHIRNQDHSPQRTPSPIQSSPSSTFHHAVVPHKRTVITSSPSSAIHTANAAHEATDSSSSNPYSTDTTGSGRLITFDHPQPLSSLITRIAHATGTPKGFPVAIPQDRSLESIKIRTVGLCPGSGSSVMRGCKEPPDLVFTGELSHHEALAIIERGGCAVCLFHSNSERGYLDGVMREKLEAELVRRWEIVRKEEQEQRKEREGKDEDMVGEILKDESVSVVVSMRDRDPFGIVVLQESRIEGETVQ